jgi:putative ABC transport system permease protein
MQTVKLFRARLGGYGVEFVPWYDVADFYRKVVMLLSRQIQVIQFIIAVIIILSISNTMLMNVLERTSEIGTRMALGRRRRDILRHFIYEGLTIGLVGGVVGVAAGILLAGLISWIGIPMPPPPGMAQGYTGRILVTAALARDALLIAVATATLASIYPAWRASRMQIVDALRHLT